MVISSFRRLLACMAIVAGIVAASGPDSSRAGDSPAAIRLTGCRIKPAGQVTLAVNESGVLDLVVREGEQVEAGSQVARLQDDVPRAALAVAEKEATNDVDLRYATVAAEVARLEHEQALKVNESVKGTVTITDLRRRKLELDQCLLRTEQARYNQEVAILKRDQAAAQLKLFHIVAPFSGTVNKVLKQQGESVRLGDPVLELVNTARVRVEGYLDAAHRRTVLPGTSVAVEPDAHTTEDAQKSLVGKIVFVDTVVQPVTKQLRVWAEVENIDEVLVPGQTATMTIVSESRPLAARSGTAQ